MPSIPHGGVVVNRVLTGQKRMETERLLPELPTLPISDERLREVENLANGIYSPLDGFLEKRDFEAVLYKKRLANGIPWTIPIVLDVTQDEAQRYGEGRTVALTFEGKAVGVLHLTEAYSFRQEEYALQVFGTTDTAHPGVAETFRMNRILLAGTVDFLAAPESPFAPYRLTPRETRVLFEAKGWRTVVGFQTRNLPHLGHEALQKTALSFVDGLFVNPLIGRKKRGDFKHEVIAAAYDALLHSYYLKQHAVMAVLHMPMRYAGPRDAIFHAIIRKNFGCTHFIVGRDHAGVGNFYHPYAAQEIFQEFPDLGIVPLFFTAFFHCRRCQGMANEKTCPHGAQDRNYFSGTALRQAIENGCGVETFIRPEIAEVIKRFDSPFVA
ncbi:MAG TPA: sulfate adenylyltransferase [Candidatus Acidoferrum sp.]|nr:sulfate adenylyltransferase [Candidatus Acidoferrum sp.]